MNTKIIKLDINKKMYETISAKQGDTESRFLLFHLFDSSLPFDLTEKSVRVYGIKPDEKKIFNDLVINDAKKGYCTLELTNQMLSVAGLVKLELVIYKGSKKLSSIPFVLNVISSLNSDDAVVSTNEFTALMNGLAALSEYDIYKSNAKQVPGIKEEVSNLSSQLDTKVYYFNTVSEMKNSSKLKVGSFVITKGYYSANDGGGSSYNIIASDSSITCNDGNYISLKNNLIAVLIIDNERIHLKQFGCKADGITDDTQKIQNAFNCQGVKYIEASREDIYLVSLTLTLISKSFNGNYAKFICSASSNFTDDYIIKANYSSYGSNDFNGNYIKNLRLINYINDVFVLNNVHGILLTGCVNADNIYGDGLNRIVKFTNEYSDYQTATKINSMRKKGDEYTVEMGYLGDAKVIDYVHHAYPQGQNNAVKVSGGMLPIKIRNIVNSNVLIQDSMAQLSDCHFEDGNVVIKNANVILNTLYLWGGNKIKIQGDSHAELNNIAFSHNIRENNPVEYDIEIDKTSEVAFNNVFRRSLGAYIDFVKKSNIKISTTDDNLTNFFNLNSGILANSCVIANNRLLNQYSFNVGSDIQIINSLATDPNGRWFKDTGNYVYRAICLIDIDRKIGRLNTNSYYQTVSITDTNKGVLIMFQDTFVPTRIFRGTSSTSYDSYIDITPKSKNLIDCGTHINGTPWKERTPGVADNINNVTSITYVNGGKNVEVYMNGMPSIGKWKKHDKVFIENPVAGGYIGWVCIADGDFSGTAPTFKKLSQLES